jgi:hypothetical protein
MFAALVWMVLAGPLPKYNIPLFALFAHAAQ